MAGQNDDNTPFIHFPNATSRERHHDYHIIKFCYEMVIILHNVEDKAHAFYARFVEFGGFYWLRLPRIPPLPGWGSFMLSSSLYAGMFLTQLFAFGELKFPFNSTTINEVLEVSEVPNLVFEEKLREIDFECVGHYYGSRKTQVY